MAIDILMQAGAATPEPTGYICLPVWAAMGIVGFPVGLYFTERKLNARREERMEKRLDELLARSRGQHATDADRAV